MTKGNDGAFAASDSYTGDGNVKQNGLTKREYFAVMAMQGIAPMFVDRACNDAGIVAKHAVDMADALIEELNKQSK